MEAKVTDLIWVRDRGVPVASEVSAVGLWEAKEKRIRYDPGLGTWEKGRRWRSFYPAVFEDFFGNIMDLKGL